MTEMKRHAEVIRSAVLTGRNITALPSALVATSLRAGERLDLELPCILCRYDDGALNGRWREVCLTTLAEVERLTNSRLPRKRLVRGQNLRPLARRGVWTLLPQAPALRDVLHADVHTRQRALDLALMSTLAAYNPTDLLYTLAQAHTLRAPAQLEGTRERLEFLAHAPAQVASLDESERHTFLRRCLGERRDHEPAHRWRQRSEMLVLALVGLTLGCEISPEQVALVFPSAQQGGGTGELDRLWRECAAGLGDARFGTANAGGYLGD